MDGQAETSVLFQLFKSWEQKSENIYCYAKWLPWGLCSNHLGQKIKRHKSIFYSDFMHLSIDNMKY